LFIWIHAIIFMLFICSTKATTAQNRLKSLIQSTCMASLSITGGAEKMYAIIETGGKQVKVQEGEAIYVEKVDAAADEKVTFDKVLFVGGDDVKVGSPYVEGATLEANVEKRILVSGVYIKACSPYVKGATVEAKVEKQVREKKISVIKNKHKKNYSRKQGHRQPYTKIVIEKINQ